jgi:hypothetical protein
MSSPTSAPRGAFGASPSMVPYLPKPAAPASPVRELAFIHDGAGWHCCLIDAGYFTRVDTGPTLAAQGWPTAEVAARALLTPAQLLAGHATFPLPAAADAAAALVAWATPTQFSVFWREEVDAPPVRHCHADGHRWVQTGTLTTWCTKCDADGHWDREAAEFREGRRAVRS